MYVQSSEQRSVTGWAVFVGLPTVSFTFGVSSRPGQEAAIPRRTLKAPRRTGMSEAFGVPST